MKRRSILTLCGGLVLGAILGYGIAVWMQNNPSQQSNPATKPDQVLAHIDFPTLLATAGEQKWSVQSFPDGVDEMEWKPIIPRQGNASTRSRRYLAKCDVPLDVNEESQFFYKFVNLLHDKIGTHAVLKGGGGEGPGYQNSLRICSNTQDFITEGEHAHLKTQRKGLTGRTLGPLNPSGVVLIDGERVPARSESGWIDAETEVEVVRDEAFGVVVRSRKPNVG